MSSSSSVAGSADRPFLHARLGSLVAVVPLGVWVLCHVWNNLAAFQGADAWQRSVTEYSHPLAQAVAGILILVPLALHTVWGIGRIASARPNNLRYGFYSNLKYLLQRLSALGVLAFALAHLWLAFLHPRLVLGHAEVFADIAGEMRNHTPTLAVYLLGTLGVSFHFANGLQTFAMGWGLAGSRRALRQLEGGIIAAFLFFLAMSWGAIYALWAAGQPAAVSLV
jgi:succinate dehydrogenase / fumarate reductase cytochrome b subunit